MVNRITRTLAKNTKLLQHEGLTYVGLFGSYSRNEATPHSDVDLLVEFNKPKSFFELANVKISLERILGKHVDMVSRKAVKRNLQKYINQDIVTIYEKR